MKIFRSSTEARGQLRCPAVAIGNFDGVHLGHQALFARVAELSREEGCEKVALTFDPHPARLFNPELAPDLLTTEAQKLALLEAHGLDAVVIERFDSDFASLSPRGFVEQTLAQNIHARHVVVGRDFVFGQLRAGNLQTLVELGREYGFAAHGVEPVRADGIVVSSTKVRNFLLMGRVRGAAVLLGRHYTVEGPVVAGKARGRTIGFRTANVEAENELLPKRGVYVGRTVLPSGEAVPAVINIGTNPTFEKGSVMTLEAHLLDFDGDLYGQRLKVEFLQRLREERRFGSVDELVAAIRDDVVRAREMLTEGCPRPLGAAASK